MKEKYEIIETYLGFNNYLFTKQKIKVFILKHNETVEIKHTIVPLPDYVIEKVEVIRKTRRKLGGNLNEKS